MKYSISFIITTFFFLAFYSCSPNPNLFRGKVANRNTKNILIDFPVDRIEKILEYKYFEYTPLVQTKKLLNVNNQFESLFEKENSKNQKKFYISIIIAALSLISLIFLIIYQKVKVNKAISEAKELKLKNEKAISEIQELLIKNRSLEEEIVRFNFVEDIYFNVISGWLKVNRKVRLLMKKDDAEEILPIYKQINKITVKHRKIISEQFLKQANYVLENRAYAELLFPLLEESKIVLFMLCYYKYKKHEMILVLDTQYMTLKIWKHDLKYRLMDCGFTEEEAEAFIFYEGKD